MSAPKIPTNCVDCGGSYSRRAFEIRERGYCPVCREKRGVRKRKVINSRCPSQVRSEYWFERSHAPE